jgi:hypothetical protein
VYCETRATRVTVDTMYAMPPSRYILNTRSGF